MPDILQRHVPNIFINKFSSRKNDLLTVNLTDDSNIEYKNIFPSILSKNRKIAVNVSLQRQADRPNDWTSPNSSHPMYQPSYKLVEKKVIAPSFGAHIKSRPKLPSLLSSPLSEGG